MATRFTTRRLWLSSVLAVSVLALSLAGGARNVFCQN